MIIKKLIIQGEKRKGIIHKEYLDSIEEFKREYLNKKAIEDELISRLQEKKYAYFIQMNLIDKFDVDDLGTVLARLLNETEDKEFAYKKIDFYTRYFKTTAPVVYPKEKITFCGENIAKCYKEFYDLDEEIIFLTSPTQSNTQITSFYDYDYLMLQCTRIIPRTYFLSRVRTYP